MVAVQAMPDLRPVADPAATAASPLVTRKTTASKPRSPIPDHIRRHPLRLAHERTALFHRISTETSTETVPHSRLVFKTAGQVSNEATVESVAAPRIARQGYQPLQQVHPR